MATTGRINPDRSQIVSVHRYLLSSGSERILLVNVSRAPFLVCQYFARICVFLSHLNLRRQQRKYDEILLMEKINAKMATTVGPTKRSPQMYERCRILRKSLSPWHDLNNVLHTYSAHCASQSSLSCCVDHLVCILPCLRRGMQRR